ncbi:MAG: isoleucine--tRNA ligase [Candidatus Saccharimonadales bacterium]
MRFKQHSRRPPIEYELDLISYWRKTRIFERSVEERPKDNSYVFYDGPPFITGVPHHGTLLSSIVKDAVPRYWTMKGKRVERVWGWDCHGLPAEVFTEKKLGISDKRDIGTKISLEDYILTCRENMVVTGNEWEATIERVGRWVDFKGAYRTMDKDYMESVWWAFKQLYDKGKIYEGEKVLLYCIRDATPISKAEVAQDNSYQDDTDPSVYVKFKLSDTKNSYLLAWTTTPWTLPANTAAAVNPDLDYAEVVLDDEIFILAEQLVSKVLVDEKHQQLPFKLLRTFKGSELVGKSYDPLFEDLGKGAHQIWAADYVSIDEGTGVVHLAPAYGEEDYELSKANHIPIVANVDDYGIYTSGEWEGMQVWEANRQIAKELHKKGTIWKIDYITHSYPHCHRCGTKLIYRAHPSWFLDVSSQKEQMLELNQSIYWFPEHIKSGRFAKTIESAPDWNISRDRFWATAMPVWKGVDSDGKEHIIVVGSYDELKELSGVELEDYHRPWVDDITFKIDGVEYSRIDKVLDCWFESGSMPFAQFHYPFENSEKFEINFPGDFIAEYVGQVRAWFYYLHTISTGLFNANAFNNVVVSGTLAGNDGRKMSKSYGNFTDPNELMDRYSADALRFLLLSSPVLNAEDFSLVDKDAADVSRKLSMIWNIYDFFSLYADVDKWEWDSSSGLTPPNSENSLDRWILSRVHQLNQSVDANMQAYDIPGALKEVLPFVDDASNWYVRRSRKRFWKTENDKDKNQAYATLHYVLVQLSQILAPFTPFLSEELYRLLTGGESVHLLNWPVAGQIDQPLLEAMSNARAIINEGLRQRAEAGIKVRQPLASVSVPIGNQDELGADLLSIIAEELNVKEVKLLTGKSKSSQLLAAMDLRITPELKKEGITREIIRNVQNARKNAGLEVDDRIDLQLGSSSEEIKEAYTGKGLADLIIKETLSLTLNAKELESAYAETVSIDGAELGIKIKRA